MIRVDTFPDWPGYLIVSIVAVVVGYECVNVIRGGWRKRKYMSLLDFVGCIGCIWIFCWMQFCQFKAVRIERDVIRLIYAWPRPDKVLHKGDIRFVTVERDRKKKGSIVVQSYPNAFRSRTFSREFAGEELAQSIERWKATL